MTRMLIAGNWKMNGDISFANTLACEIARKGRDDRCEYLLCPPYTALASVAEAIRNSNISLGGQDCHTAPSGAHTGDISVDMLNDIGCTYIIVGHSERRSNHGETNEVVQIKARAAIAGGLQTIICVGENGLQRDTGEAFSVVSKQVEESLPDCATYSNTIIAYEPVWAIGTGRIPAVEQIAEMHMHIKTVLSKLIGDDSTKCGRVLYGGSVNSENAVDILATQGVDGALVGGASLKADSFLAIGQSCPSHLL